MFNDETKAAWTPPVLESIEMIATWTKEVANTEAAMNCTGPAQSSSPPGCGS